VLTNPDKEFMIYSDEASFCPDGLAVAGYGLGKAVDLPPSRNRAFVSARAVGLSPNGILGMFGNRSNRQDARVFLQPRSKV
jgi:hypothetical protein